MAPCVRSAVREAAERTNAAASGLQAALAIEPSLHYHSLFADLAPLGKTNVLWAVLRLNER
ncbi:MAG: hypothetical protein KBH81_03850, partial [Phycisphaerae bacterium]|nr:hypothetical protein [Phycisphaerae bacterium]